MSEGGMSYIRIPGVSKPVSRIVLGAAGQIFASGGDVSSLIGAALDHGVNALDTARQYGRSENAIGAWLRSGGDRDSVVIISKGCHPDHNPLRPRVNERAASEDLKRSLDALNTDHIDIYLLHRDDESVPVGRIVDFLNRFHEEGLIGAFGGSNWRAKRVAEANAYAAEHGLTGFAVSSPHYSLGRQRHDPWCSGCKTVTGPGKEEERRYYRETGMPLLAWSSLCGGLFSGRLRSGEWGRLQSVLGLSERWAYGSADNRERLARCEELARKKSASVAQIALAWLLNGDLNALPVIGASSPDRIAANAAAAGISLTKAETRYLNLEE